MLLVQLLLAQSGAALPANGNKACVTTYFISVDGDDNAPGTSAERPWRTLGRAENAKLGPGDCLLLKAGDSFVGQLVLRASGAPGLPLRIGAYGGGAKPLLMGDGFAAAILIRNQDHIEIRDIAITNDVQQARPGEPPERSFGIEVLNDGGGILSHFRFERLTISDVFAQRINDRTEAEFNRVIISAIRFSASQVADDRPSFFRDIVISGNHISRSGRFGVQIGHSVAGEGRQDAHSRDPDAGFNRDIVIRDNHFADLGGSAVQLSGARHALIENNDFDRTGSLLVPGRMVGRGSGAWVINSRDIVAQHNRSRQVRGYKDSYGMHVDYGNLNILYQYNFSTESEGGFVEILGNNRNVIWRYNISVNDGLREKAGNTLWFSPFSQGMIPSSDIHIYNNTVYVRPGLYPDIDLRARGAVILNNIFAVAREAMIGEQLRIEMGGGTLDMAGNLFAGSVNPDFRSYDSAPRQGAPLFVQPGATDPAGYRLRPGSPALGKGVAVAHPPFPAAGIGIFHHVTAVPSADFFGTALPVSGEPTIGASVTTEDWR